jgi:hypothetical protein
LYQVYQSSTQCRPGLPGWQQHEVHLSLIQAASQGQDTGGGSYLTNIAHDMLAAAAAKHWCCACILGGLCYKWILSPLNGTLHTR